MAACSRSTRAWSRGRPQRQSVARGGARPGLSLPRAVPDRAARRPLTSASLFGSPNLRIGSETSNKENGTMSTTEQEIPGPVLEYLGSQSTLTLATASPTGTPHAATFLYVNDGPALFFWSKASTVSSRQIDQTPL